MAIEADEELPFLRYFEIRANLIRPLHMAGCDTPPYGIVNAQSNKGDLPTSFILK